MPALRKAVCQAVSVKSSAIGLDRKQNPMLPGLGFEYGDALDQFVLRISVERLAGQLARGISAHAGEIVLVHGRAG